MDDKRALMNSVTSRLMGIRLLIKILINNLICSSVSKVWTETVGGLENTFLRNSDHYQAAKTVHWDKTLLEQKKLISVILGMQLDRPAEKDVHSTSSTSKCILA